MKLRVPLVGSLLLLAVAPARPQEIELQAELTVPLATDTNRKGDLITARVLGPAAFQGDILEGKVTDSRSGGKMRGQAVLSFTFETLRHGGQAVPVSTQVKSVSNSKGQVDVDEEGRVIRKTSNVGKAVGGTAIGGLIGGLAGGAKGAAIGAGVGAAASIVLIQVAADGPSVRFAAGSKVVVSAKARGGPALTSLAANTAPAAPAAAPAPSAPSSTPAAAPPAAPAAPAQQPASAAPASSAQPDLTAIKADFIPGEKTIFFDDFTDMAGDEPPPHWKVRGGTAELRSGQGVRQLTMTAPRVVLTPNLTAIPQNFTLETELRFNGHSTVTSWTFSERAARKEAMFLRLAVNYANLSVLYKVGSEVITDQQVPTDFNAPVKLNLWIQNGRLRCYINGQRVFDVNQISVPEMAAPEIVVNVDAGADRRTDRHVGFRLIRFAESAPDFSKMISSSGRYVTHGILFDTGSDRIRPESAAVIKTIARGLETNPALKLQVEGHTDSVGNAEMNLDLSKRRAEAVKAVLVSQFNVDASRLTTAGLGATKPIESNDTPTGRAQNRRVEFVRQ